MTQRILTLDNVSLSFPAWQGEVRVLNNISLHINRGRDRRRGGRVRLR
ncbi:Uncharacterised protein [Pluralibacter gergoviae]|nr:Uncharacterised protein [Pluralibacter gergoviae]